MRQERYSNRSQPGERLRTSTAATTADASMRTARDEQRETIDAPTRGGASRRGFLGRSGKLLIYTPPLIQLFIPTRAMAASPSS